MPLIHKKRIFARLFLLLPILTLNACRDRESEIAETISIANQNLAAGEGERAIAMLERLNNTYPGDLALLESLAFAYAEQGDFMLAAHYFLEIANSDPAEKQYLIYAGETLKRGEDLEGAAEAYREYLKFQPTSAEAWNTLGQITESLLQPRAAIEAYLESHRLKPAGRSALRLGTLFSELGNVAQAESWYQIAIELGDGSEAQAYLGLLALALELKNYPLAEKIVKHIDAIYPGKLDVSHLAFSRSELERWREQHEKLSRKLEEQERIAQELSEKTAAARKEEQEVALRASELAEAELKLAALELSPPPPSAAEFIDNARRLRQDQRLSEATQKYWEAIKLDDSRPEIWYELSETLLQDNQLAWAEATALEALRRNSQSSLFNLQYLAVAQRSKAPEEFLRELIKAKERIPHSPEITLALARGYKNITQSHRNAAILYREFLEMVPYHPNRDAIETELNALAQP